MVISLDGNVLHEVLSTSLLGHAKINPLIRLLGFVDVEESHFNSLLEIPTIKVKTQLPYLKAGNFIANNDGTFIYSKNKKSILKVIRETHFRDSKQFPTHELRLYDLRKFLSFWKQCSIPDNSKLHSIS